MSSKFGGRHTQSKKPIRIDKRKGLIRKKDANVSGFQRRMAKRPAKASSGMDVYEYNEKDRKGRFRADVALELTKEEVKEYGVDEESDQDDLQKMRDRLKFGDEVPINSEDDEEIDSDDAFDESDEERFGAYNLKGTKRKATSSKSTTANPEIDLDEHDSESDEGEAEGGSEEDDEGQSDSEAMVAEDDENNSEDDPDDEALDRLGALIGTMVTTAQSVKRSASQIEEAEGEPPRQKRRILKEQTQAGIEGEFAPATQSKGKLQLADLITPLSAEQGNPSTLTLKSAAKTLNSAKAGPLSAPLPTRIQDRLERQAAYEQTKTEIQTWEPTMRRIREADHLSFPLQAQPTPQGNISAMASNFKPTTELESAVDRLLKAAELRESDIQKTEELQMQHLSIEEIAERRAELRKARDLMFRAEIKAKRVAKIKSKTYRKIQKKERAKQVEKLKDMGLDIDEETEQLKAEAERAEERATLKHKNKGKWAVSMRNRGEVDQDQRKDMQEMYERGQQLRRKIKGVNSDEEESDSSNSSEEEEDQGVINQALRAIDHLDQEDEETPTFGNKSGLMEMKFMKNAVMRDDNRAREAVDSFKHELQKLGLDEAGGKLPSEEVAGKTRGRVSFNPAAVPSTGTENADGAAESDGGTSEINGPSSGTNPWLSVGQTSTKISRKKNEVVVGKNSSAAALSKNAMKKRMRKNAESIALEKDDATLEINPNPGVTPAKPVEHRKAKPKATNDANIPGKTLQKVDAMLSEDSESDDAPPTTPQGRRVAFEQRELVARAFAGDDLVEDFASEKRKEMEVDAPKEIDTTLPGWGTWGGAGITKRPPKPERIKRFPGVDPKKRQDYGKDHVIISEKKDKKAEKYLVKDLPFPYTSKAQFERRLEVPLGMEWNTRTTFQKATLPRVVKKMGTAIEPLEKLF